MKAPKAEKIPTDKLVGETLSIIDEMLNIISSRTGMDGNDRGTMSESYFILRIHTYGK